QGIAKSMLFFTRWKAAAILLTAFVVCLCAVPNFFPESTVKHWPSWAQRHIVLGLDLQGGSHLLLQVDANAVRKERLQSLNDDVLRVLRQARIQFTGRAIVGNGVQVHITRDTDMDNALAKLRELSTPLSGILGASGQRSIDVTANAGVITLTPTDAALTERIRQAVDQSIQIIDGEGATKYLIEKRVLVSGSDLTDAQPGFDQRSSEPIVSFRFNSSGARKFAEATQANVGKPFAIVLDNKVISAPVIREPILGGSGQISGSFTVQSANDLSILLRAGALPAPLTIIEERTVGPGLGQDSITAGEHAAYAGAALVIIFMFATYGLFGLFANIAVAVNIAMIFGVLSLLSATLTLPG